MLEMLYLKHEICNRNRLTSRVKKCTYICLQVWMENYISISVDTKWISWGTNLKNKCCYFSTFEINIYYIKIKQNLMLILHLAFRSEVLVFSIKKTWLHKKFVQYTVECYARCILINWRFKCNKTQNKYAQNYSLLNTIIDEWMKKVIY